MRLVCHLQKALYGLKQALYILYTLISKFLQRLQFMKTDIDHSVFISYNKSMFISIYVNSFFIISDDLNIINNLKNKLLECFCMTDLELVSHDLSISVTKIKNFVILDQKSYLEKIVLQFGINTVKPASLPMDLEIQNSMLSVSEN